MTVLWANNASALLAAPVGLGDTSITLQTGTGALFPNPTGADYFYLTLSNTIALEIVKCTARTGDTLTVVRAQDGTVAIACVAGDRAELRVTRAGLNESLGSAGKVLYSARTSNTIITVADKGSLIDITSGTFTQTFSASTNLTDGFYCYLRNSGTGDITLDPDGTETIDGLSSFIMYPSEVRLVQCDGSTLRSIVLQGFNKTITSSSNFIKPPGYAQFEGLLWGGGASGSKATTETAGGGGGACVPFRIRAVDVSTTTVVTIAAGGAAVTTANTQGNAGGNSTFGSLVTAYGGGPAGPSAATQYGGSGGGSLSAGSTGTSAGAGGGLPAGGHSAIGDSGSAFGGGVGGTIVGGKSHYGGGGGNTLAATQNSGDSYYGGGGGSGHNGTTAGAVGVSVIGGSGGVGASTTNGGDGVAPAGGGGGTRTAARSGAGARGELRIWGIV